MCYVGGAATAPSLIVELPDGGYRRDEPLVVVVTLRIAADA